MDGNGFEERVLAFAQKVGTDQSVALGAALAYVGDRLGLWAALAGSGPVTAAELAERTGLAERYLREWLAAETAAGYLDHDAGRFTLPPDRAAVLADDDSPAAMAGGFEFAAALWAGTDRLGEAFRTGAGIAWGDQDGRLAGAVDHCFRADYRSELLTTWLPALDGVVDRLRAGARVLDVGCGFGSATALIAEAFPASTVHGVDPHEPSVRAAEKAASGRATFAVGGATDYPADGWDLVCFFDALHDMGDPVGAARHAREALAPGGIVLLVEPGAGDALDENLNPVGLTYYAASTAFCVPGALAQAGTALGAQAGAAQLMAVLEEAGFTQVRVAVRDPFHLVVEARP
ncbi:class I SAM-dependent methyltransferase [Pseudonocardia sp. NPDC049154]|uniref:class I SAM-dependent methyltransferase n=1 Tax=Pseudonocardia sp. NPDC049154 TaxID=3155501 RepID=UPI0033EA12B2